MNYFKLIKISLIFLVLSLTSSKAAVYNKNQAASTYEVVITRIQICGSGSSLTDCVNPAEVFNDTSAAIDIANTTAGAAAASLGKPTTFKTGETYSFIQVTMSRSVTIAGGGTATSAGNQACYTNGTAGTAAQSALGSTSSGDLADAVVFIGIAGTTNNGTNFNSVNAGDGTGTSAADGTVTSGHTHIEWRGALDASYTHKQGYIPSVTIAFGTATALGFYTSTGDTNNDCDTRASGVTTTGFYAGEPDVTITIK